MQKSLKFIRENRIFKMVILIAVFIFPTIVFLEFFQMQKLEIHPYDFMWIGFYSCLLLLLSYNNKIIKVLAIALNLVVFLFLAFGSLMGGITAPLWLIAKMIIPFI